MQLFFGCQLRNIFLKTHVHLIVVNIHTYICTFLLPIFCIPIKNPKSCLFRFFQVAPAAEPAPLATESAASVSFPLINFS